MPLSQIIVTSRYLKSGGQKNHANYVKYIATRQGSVAVKQNIGTAPAADIDCLCFVKRQYFSV